MKIDRLKIYQKYGGKCAYCGIPIEFKKMQVDHLWPRFLANHRKGLNNDRPENLMPSCPKCNIHKSGMTIDVWRAELQRQVKMLRKNAQFDRALRFQQIIINEIPISFYYEQPTGGRHE